MANQLLIQFRNMVVANGVACTILVAIQLDFHLFYFQIDLHCKHQSMKIFSKFIKILFLKKKRAYSLVESPLDGTGGKYWSAI